MRTVLCICVALFFGLLFTLFSVSIGLAVAAMLSSSFEWTKATLIWHGRAYTVLCYTILINVLVVGRIRAWPNWLKLVVFTVLPLVLMMLVAPYSESYQALYGLVCIAALPAYQLVRQLFFRRG